jgi:tetratricopeptide (TPR) repeat protein
LIEYYARNNNFEKANELLATAKQRFPTDTKVKTLTAQLSVIEGAFALSKQDIPKARILLMKGLQAKPNDTRLQSLLVKTEIAAKNFLEASKITDQLAINNGNLAMLMRGDIAFAKEKYTIALNHYQTLWDNASSDTVANRIITIYNTQDDPDGKTRFIDIWGEKLPNSPNMLLMRGIQHISSGRYKQSITDLEKLRSLQKNKVSPIVLNNLAWAYLKTQNLAKAIQDAEKAYQLAPESAAIADTYGWILHNTEQQDKAIEILQIANKLGPESEEIRQHLNIAKGIPGF